MRNIKPWIKIKCYLLWLLQVIAFFTPWRDHAARAYIKAFYYDWLCNNAH